LMPSFEGSLHTQTDIQTDRQKNRIITIASICFHALKSFRCAMY